LTHLQLSDDYLKRGLSGYLYDAPLQYLKDIEFEGNIHIYVDLNNTTSINAAKRNGFHLEPETDGGFAYMNYKGYSSIDNKPTYSL